MAAKSRFRLVALAVSAGVACFVGEGLYRGLRRADGGGGMYFRAADGRAVRPGALPFAEEFDFYRSIEMLVPAADAPPWFGTAYAMPRATPWKNTTWLPGARFYLCYDGPRQPYFDERGCVEMRFNQFGIRDREDLTLDKPAGVRRVVCLGDSFTLGWGVRREHAWPVLLEAELQRQTPALQVVNCGGCGSAYADEYELALRHRFGRFGPDLVLVTLCLNDLI